MRAGRSNPDLLRAPFIRTLQHPRYASRLLSQINLLHLGHRRLTVTKQNLARWKQTVRQLLDSNQHILNAVEKLGRI